MTSPLLSNLGNTQGKLVPKGWTAPQGSAVMCLGNDTPGHIELLAPGHGVAVQQTADVGPLASTPHTLIAFRGRLRGPSAMPAGWRWVAAWGDGTSTQEVEIPVGRTVDLNQQMIWVRESSSPTSVRFRLYLDGPVVAAQDIELPAFYVDALSLLNDQSPIATIFRYPENGHTDVPRNQLVRLVVACLSPIQSPIDVNTTRIYVNNELAYEGFAFLPGYDGPDSVVNQINDTRAEFIIDKVGLFDSDSDVTIRAELYLDGGQQLTETWTFSVVDETPPQVVAATALNKTTVRVAFNEPVSAVTATNPNNYVLDGLEVPFFVPAIASVSKVNDTSVDLVFAQELSPGVVYQLIVVGVSDTHGNVVTAPNNTATFTAARFLAPRGRVLDVWGLWPEMNQDEDGLTNGDLEKLSAALQEVFALVLSSIDEWVSIIDYTTAAERFIDARLASMGNPFPFVLALIDKRRLLSVLVDIYRQKGTNRGIKNVVRFFVGIEVDVVAATSDGFALGVSELGIDTYLGMSNESAAYSFYLQSAIVLTPEQRSKTLLLAEYMKPAHTHLLGLLEPPVPEVIDHVELGLSELNTQFLLH